MYQNTNCWLAISQVMYWITTSNMFNVTVNNIDTNKKRSKDELVLVNDQTWVTKLSHLAWTLFVHLSLSSLTLVSKERLSTKMLPRFRIVIKKKRWGYRKSLRRKKLSLNLCAHSHTQQFIEPNSLDTMRQSYFE